MALHRLTTSWRIAQNQVPLYAMMLSVPLAQRRPRALAPSLAPARRLGSYASAITELTSAKAAQAGNETSRAPRRTAGAPNQLDAINNVPEHRVLS